MTTATPARASLHLDPVRATGMAPVSDRPLSRILVSRVRPVQGFRGGRESQRTRSLRRLERTA